MDLSRHIKYCIVKYCTDTTVKSEIRENQLSKDIAIRILLVTSIENPWHIGVDPDPGISASD